MPQRTVSVVLRLHVLIQHQQPPHVPDHQLRHLIQAGNHQRQQMLRRPRLPRAHATSDGAGVNASCSSREVIVRLNRGYAVRSTEAMRRMIPAAHPYGAPTAAAGNRVTGV
ncbi:hypothetical protein FBY35_0084 [Streptomyces sp. SLBN-118]|nr:hypothetical protein FBY35_0084 [Streptomyces sp. SLBN-118]